MKCHKPCTDQEAELTVFVNGFACQEYVHESNSTYDANILECFIPVSDGDKITISGYFNGTVLHGALDLLADGSFLADKRIEGPKSGEAKYIKRKVDFQKAFHTPIPKDHTRIYPCTHMIEGTLHVKALDNAPASELGGHLGVGSLAFIISVNQRTEDMYEKHYPDMTCGEWRNRFTEDGGDGGVPPTHELEVRDLGEPVHMNRNSKHRRHQGQKVFGNKPWATFVFYYRRRMAIHQAGCVIRPSISHALEPAGGDGEIFVRDSTEPMGKGRKKKEKVVEQVDDEEIIVVSRKSLSAHANSMSMTPPLAKRPKLFGNSLFGQLDPTKVSGSAADGHQASTERQKSVDGCDFIGPRDDDYETGTMQDDEQQQNITPILARDEIGRGDCQLQDMGDESLVYAVTGANEFLDGEQTHGPTIPNTKTMLPSTATETEQGAYEQTGSAAQQSNVDQEVEPYIKEEEVDEDSKDIFVFDDADKIVGAETSLEQAALNNEPDETNTSSTERMSGLEKVPSTSTNIPPTSKALQLATSILECTIDTDKAENFGQATSTTTNTQSTIQNITANSPGTHDKSTPKSATSPQPNPATPALTQASFLKKRTASNTSLSRESTPNKKFRSAGNSDRLANLRVQKEQKEQRNLTTKREIKKQKEMRVEEERKKEEAERKRDEAEMREIEELERMNEAEDLEFEELVRAQQAAEAELEEMRLARERAEEAIRD